MSGNNTMFCVYQEHTEKTSHCHWTKITILGLFSDEVNANRHFELMKAERELVHKCNEVHVYMTSFEIEVPIEHDLD